MFPLCQDNKEVLDTKKQLEKQKSDASKRGTPTQNYGCIICESHKLQTASNHSTKDCKFLSEYKASNRPHYRPDKANSCYFCHIHGWGNHGTKVCRSLPDIIPQQTPPPRTNENPEEIVIKVMIDTNVIGTTTVTENGTQTKHVDITETNQEAVTMRTADQMTMSEIGEMNTQGTVIQDRTMTQDHLQTQGECITRVINPTKSQNVTRPDT